jgi:hypothetical protein
MDSEPRFDGVITDVEAAIIPIFRSPRVLCGFPAHQVEMSVRLIIAETKSTENEPVRSPILVSTVSRCKNG